MCTWQTIAIENIEVRRHCTQGTMRLCLHHRLRNGSAQRQRMVQPADTSRTLLEVTRRLHCFAPSEKAEVTGYPAKAVCGLKG